VSYQDGRRPRRPSSGPGRPRAPDSGRSPAPRPPSAPGRGPPEPAPGRGPDRGRRPDGRPPGGPGGDMDPRGSPRPAPLPPRPSSPCQSSSPRQSSSRQSSRCRQDCPRSAPSGAPRPRSLRPGSPRPRSRRPASRRPRARPARSSGLRSPRRPDGGGCDALRAAPPRLRRSMRARSQSSRPRVSRQIGRATLTPPAGDLSIDASTKVPTDTPTWVSDMSTGAALDGAIPRRRPRGAPVA
jgi:hypothetical protein